MILDGLIGLLVLVPLFLIVQRRVHEEAQALFYLLTQRIDFALALFSLLVLPGVIIHETSHFVMATLLRVPVTRFSVIPKAIGNNKLRMGYVETAKVDFLRDAIIGFAPLFLGSVMIALIGFFPLRLGTAWQSFPAISLDVFKDTILAMTRIPDFWMWFYLVVAISTTMFPSASDRRAGFFLFAFVMVIGAGLWMAGGQALLLELARGPVNVGLRAFCAVLGMSLAFHVVVFIPIYLLRRIAQSARGLHS